MIAIKPTLRKAGTLAAEGKKGLLDLAKNDKKKDVLVCREVENNTYTRPVSHLFGLIKQIRAM